MIEYILIVFYPDHSSFFRSEYLSIEPCIEQQVFRFEDQGEVLGGVADQTIQIALQIYSRSMVYWF